MSNGEWIEYTQHWEEADPGASAWPMLAVAASPTAELLYAGDSSGRVSVFTLNDPGQPLDRHASVLCAQAPVRRLMPMLDERVFVQSDDAVLVLTDGGRQLFKRTTLPNEAFSAAAMAASGQQAFVCTSAGAGSLLDIAEGRVVKKSILEQSVGAAYFGDVLVLGTASGEIVGRDPRTPANMLWTTLAFGGPVTDIAGSQTCIYVCGDRADPTQPYHMEPDETVRVYDMRNIASPVDSILCSGGAPSWLQVNGDELWIGHLSGYAEARRLSRLSEEAEHLYIEPALDEYACVSAFAASPSGQVAMLADTAGALHVWAASDHPQLSTSGRASDFLVPDVGSEDEQAVGGEGIDISDESVALSCVNMPAVTEPLLSFTSNSLRWDIGRPANFVDPAILASLKMMDSIGYAPNPRTRRRNQLPFGKQWRTKWKQVTMYDDSELTQGVAKFISQQRYESHGNRRGLQKNNEKGLGSPDPSTTRSNVVPAHLRRMQIEYSRFGVEDFDFSLYNSTRWSGLEGDMRHSYANPLLQLLFFTPEFRTLMLSHCASECTKAACLSCQMGFLFRMLDTAESASCHATMLLQVLEERQDADALALLEDRSSWSGAAGGSDDAYAILAQRLLRFLLEQATSECKDLDDVLATESDPGRRKAVERIFGFRQLTQMTCTTCESVQARESHVASLELDPPQGSAELALVLAGGATSIARADALRSGKKIGFIQLLERALAKSLKAKGWCASCRKFQLMQTDKFITGPPAGYVVLNFPSQLPVDTAAGATDLAGGANASSTNEGANSWQMTLPTMFELDSVPSDDGHVQRVHVRAPDNPSTAGAADGGGQESDSGTSGARRQFRLAAVVSEIRDQPRGRGHLVVHVRNPDDPCKWLLFNDFLVQPASEDSVTRLYDKWRMPSIAVYADESREDLASIVEAVVDRHPYKFSTSILTSPSSSLDGAFPPLHSPQRNLGAGATGGKAPALASASPKRNEAVALTAAEAGLLDAGEFACALDAEFVVLEEAVTEESSDGTCHVRRPPVYTMARLSAVRANGGPLHGAPFIDDYVATSRPVADLVTQFSGIHVGDLTLGISPYKLSTMKEVYRKLRLLVDSGSTIIGHGLARDFRVSNIIVPASQVRDTMLLFQSPSNPRAVSLRFLYWYFYKKAIQTGEHSSVEDSYATLKVYQSYQQAVNEHGDGFTDDVVEDIYATGEQMGWRIPDPLL